MNNNTDLEEFKLIKGLNNLNLVNLNSSELIIIKKFLNHIVKNKKIKNKK